MPGTMRNAIDAFVLTKLREDNLRQQPEADRATLARRLALDLTGLPPSLAEVDSFVKDAAPDAHDRFVNRLIDSPAYGEHWARMWLDLARYADSTGYPSDQPREIWAYRDWVIRALNANMPFDQFTIEQHAGDLLQNPTEDQIIATAFHRNTMTNNEGGTIDEEFRVAAVVDRVNTTMAVWMGTSFACAQCHTHKYDPITHREYFQIYAILNQSADADRKDEAPILEFYPPEKSAKRATLQAEIAALKTEGDRADIGAAAEEKRRATNLPVFGTWIPAQIASVTNFAVRSVTPAMRRAASLGRELAALKPERVPIMRDVEAKQQRVTKVQLRGSWRDLGEEVTPGTPAAFPPMARGEKADRLALARWMVSRENPLTARVAVNRIWEHIFGTGIVRTSEEFGAQGDLPSHPELLDWLAVEVMENGWDVKHIVRLLMNSRTYRQGSGVSPDAAERDPDNRMLARGPRFRPTGELLRDQALAISGLLSRKMYGPGVRPLAPDLGLKTAFGRSNDWKASEGEDRHRRSIYTEVRRNNPYASFATFDAPNRETCTIRRSRSNTPLQAFVTLNDPVFIEAAQALARRIFRKDVGTGVIITEGFQRCVSRLPTDAEIARLTRLHEDTRTAFQADPIAAREFATNPLGPLPNGMNAADLAAWTAVANVLLNLDETLMRK